MNSPNERLLEWYDIHKRDLPWRRTKDVYSIWVSEIMLQQTRIATVLPYYERWIARFPNLESLASADEQELLTNWEGLGYYSRCRNLQAGARFVLDDGIPSDSIGWIAVPGVGPYTAAAISSICFGEPVGSVDGNFLRVFARLNASRSKKAELTREASQWARRRICNLRSGDWNQAMMELGATICTPTKPKCSSCPLESDCQGKVFPENFPMRIKKRKTVSLNWLATIYWDGTCIGLEQIPVGGWWEGMWCLPTLLSPVFKATNNSIGIVSGTVTHHKINLRIEVLKKSIPESLVGVPICKLSDIALPSLYRKAIDLAISQDVISEPKCLPALGQTALSSDCSLCLS